MKPVKTPETNITLTLPGGTTDNDLPAQRGMLYDPDAGDSTEDAVMGYVSTWMPSEEEASRLDAGGAIELTIWGAQHPPVKVAVTAGVLPSREMIRRDHVDRALGWLYANVKDRIEALLADVDPGTIGFPGPELFATIWAEAVDATNPDAVLEAAKAQADEIRNLPETDHPKED